MRDDANGWVTVLKKAQAGGDASAILWADWNVSNARPTSQPGDASAILKPFSQTRILTIYPSKNL